MNALPESLYNDVHTTLLEAGREDLATRFRSYRPKEVLTSGEAAARLGVSSANTVKNWLEAGRFPGAYQTPGGHWRFLREDVEAVLTRMEATREENRRGDLAPPDLDDTAETPPLL